MLNALRGTHTVRLARAVERWDFMYDISAVLFVIRNLYHDFVPRVRITVFLGLFWKSFCISSIMTSNETAKDCVKRCLEEAHHHHRVQLRP